MEFQMQMTEFDPESIIHYAQIVRETVGPEWVEKRIGKFIGSPQKSRKYTTVPPIPRHELIYWFLNCRDWHREGIQSGNFDVSAIVIKLAVLGRSLERVRNAKNFSKILKRLKSIREFKSAVFEVEIAERYIVDGFTVEFVREKAERTPDLLVTRPDGFNYWVECKRRDDLTSRDKRVKSIWDELETRFVRKLRSNKQNYFIAIKANTDPIRDDIEFLYDLIIKSTETGGLGTINPDTKLKTSYSCANNKFEVVATKLSDPDYPIETEIIGFTATEHFDRGTILSDMYEESGLLLLA